jgi:Domain of unknown function (DUF5658)
VGARTANVVVVLFLIVQACDGVFTYVGIRQYGASIEANPLLAWLMGALGQGLGLTAAKATAGAFGIALHLGAVHRVVAVLAGVYLLVAVIPWIGLLFIS